MQSKICCQFTLLKYLHLLGLANKSHPYIHLSLKFKAPAPAVGLLAGLSEEKRKLLCAYGDFINLEDGQQLIEEGDNQDFFYLVISGALQVHAYRNGHYTPIADMGPGDSIGEINLFNPGKASASVIAHSRVQIWKVTRYCLETIIQSDPELGMHLLIALVSKLSRRIRSLNGKFLAVEKFAKCKRSQHSGSEQYHHQGMLEDISGENRN